MKRSNNFVPQLLLALQNHAQFSCPYDTLPISYQQQPYNLGAKIKERGGFDVKVIFSKANNTFIVIKQNNIHHASKS